MNELYALSASELAPLLQNKKVSPVEVTQSVIRRIDELDDVLNSYITFLPDYAMEQAKCAEESIMKGNYLGPLHGIPTGIKDLFKTKGIRTTNGSILDQDNIPDKNATTVDKLLKAGVILVGKLNTHEYAGGLSNISPFFGASRNPWNPNYMTGGSSGGSGAALAAGLATLATGSDTFGSIRTPASMCGVYGIKPTYGRISTQGITPLAASLDHPGPMARSISDLALMLNVMAGYDKEDPTTINVKVPDYTECLNKSVKGLKIGLPRYFLEGLDPEVEHLFYHAINLLEDEGITILDLDIPELSMSSFAAYVVMMVEASNFHYEKLRNYPEHYGQDVRILFETGLSLDTVHYLRAQQARRKIVDAVKETFKNVDVLAAPALPITVPCFQDNWVLQNLDLIRRCMPFTSPSNVTGTPSLAVPIGFSSNGLPVGMQLMGNHLNESTLLQLGSAWEKIYKGLYPNKEIAML